MVSQPREPAAMPEKGSSDDRQPMVRVFTSLMAEPDGHGVTVIILGIYSKYSLGADSLMR